MTEQPGILINCTARSSRLDFIASFLSDVTGVNFRVSTGTPSAVTPFVIEYSVVARPDKFSVYDSGFLFGKEIKRLVPEIKSSAGETRLFPTNGPFNVPFDVFSAIFYLISRYEEYLPFIPDNHGRFEAAESFSYRNKFLDEPIVDRWIIDLRYALVKRFPQLVFPERNFTFLPTIDIDSPWAFNHRPIGYNIPGLLKNLATGKWSDLIYRMKVLSGRVADPFDVYRFINETERQWDFRSVFFFLLQNRKPFDLNHSVDSDHFTALVRLIASDHTVGIHPSYGSANDPEFFEKEIKRFHEITGSDPVISRQHFLKLRFPDTYRRLVRAGISEDFSMGYASCPGFRAGTTLPFRFYDLNNEVQTSLIIHPFAVMDVTLRQYLKLDPSQATNAVRDLMEKVKSVNGIFTCLWHNESLSEFKEWTGWRNVFTSMANTAVKFRKSGM